ncbi:MAG TPA: pyruvate kinase [bacterium]|nr:pyruvate kinase [bacterium]
MTKTKIITTLGPATATVEMMRALIAAGADIFRLNMSHGDHEKAAAIIMNARQAAELEGRFIPLFMDLRGPKLRIGKMEKDEATLAEGGEFTITTRPVAGNAALVSTDYPYLPGDVHEESTILLDDGQIVLKVLAVTGNDVKCRVIVGGVLKSNKGMALPGVRVKLPALTDKDKVDARFGMEQGVDGFMLSFVQHRADILDLHRLMQEQGLLLPVIAKIETASALDELADIAAIADALLVARGDLGVELPIAQLPHAQKTIVTAAHAARIPAIVATEMLESMIVKNRPTRAEVTDVAHAVADGADAVMLSAETASGKYPVKAVMTMDAVAEEAERHLPPSFKEIAKQNGRMLLSEGLSYAAVKLADNINADALILYSISGYTARIAAYFAPSTPIFAFTGDGHVARVMNLFRGVRGLVLEQDPDTFDDFIATALPFLLARELILPGQTVVAANVSSTATTRRHANAIRVVNV